MKHLIRGIVATFVVSLVVAAPASAKTVYNYVYSGDFIDGSTTSHTFDGQVGGLHYDRASHELFVVSGGTPSFIQKFSPAGVPQNFSALGSPTLNIGSGLEQDFGEMPQIAVDQTGTANDGNFYIEGTQGFGGGNTRGYNPDGSEILALRNAIEAESLCGIGVDPSGRIIAASRNGIYHYNVDGTLETLDFAGSPGLQPGIKLKWEERSRACNFATDAEGNMWGRKSLNNRPVKLASEGLEYYELNTKNDTEQQANSPAAVDFSNGDAFFLERSGGFAGTWFFTQYDKNGAVLGTDFGKADPGHSYLGLVAPKGIAVDPETHDVWISNKRDYGSGVRHVEKFEAVEPTKVPDTRVVEPDYPSPTGATVTLKGVLNPDGVETTECRFEYGPTQAVTNSVPCAQGNNLTGSSDIPVSASVPVTKGSWYFFRLSAKNGNGRISLSGPRRFIPKGKPILGAFNGAELINTDGAQFRSEFDPNGGNASVHFEYGVNGNFEFSTPESSLVGFTSANSNFEGSDTYQPGIYTKTALGGGLSPGTVYEVRAVVSNEAGSTVSTPQKFQTYLKEPSTDPCPNALARQQSGSSLILDCRGYELVSASNTGGFDVVSDLVGQEPLGTSPLAGDRLLYSVDSGVIPGVAGSPTNLGRDPYVATRDPQTGVWTTSYVGLPADGMEDPGAFGSPLLGTDQNLSSFAFGGADICDPCFADGSTNIPLRRNGLLSEGMAGPTTPPAGQRDRSGTVAKYLSADGGHLVFGASKRFHLDGNEGSVTIYDRDLNSGTTQVVSTLPNGNTMTGEVGELDISSDGSRIVVGTSQSVDGAGNVYWHPYMHIGGSKNSVDLAPLSTIGVLFAGMTADGSRVFFTSTEKLAPGDNDNSADLYQAAVPPAGGPAVLTRLSTGSAPVGDVDTCDPSANADGNNWNAVGGASVNSCGVVAIGGGAGVAPEGGAVYFFSPEKLDGTGTLNEPNLYVAEPGQAPTLVATLEPGNAAVRDAVKDNEVRRYGDFQISGSGRFALFGSSLALTPVETNGLIQTYLHDRGGTSLDCVSCPPTLVPPTVATSPSTFGQGLTDDGRVFFTTDESLVLRDTNLRKDAYEWSDGAIQLISTGIGEHDSSLLSVTSDGTNAYFFTRDTLVHGDDNGSRVKIYNARQGGGAVFNPPPLPCAASDECHGAGTEPPGLPNINTQTGAGSAASLADRCDSIAARAQKNRALAARLRRKADNAASGAARALRRKARKAAKKARQLEKNAQSCRRSSGGNG